jgi:large subunit ribosomal protein L15
MKLHTLKPAAGSTSNSKRIGRGQGSGKGGTSARGHKGAKSRSGYSKKIGFEGGQMPLQRRVPKFGFKNPNRVEYVAINLDRIEKIATERNLDTIKATDFVNFGFASKKELVKILGNGELTKAIEVEAHKFSSTAAEKIEKAGGKVITVEK